MSSDQGESHRFFNRIPQQDLRNYTFDRAAAERDARERRQQYDRQQIQAACEMFHTRRGLIETIAAEIFPTIVTLKSALGVTGTGFFQHSEWLVSNAHIIPFKDVISHTTIIDAQNKTLQLEAENSYHRPSEKDDAPDVVIIKTQSRNTSKCLRTEFSGDESYDKTCFLYAAPILSRPGEFEIKFLRLRSKAGEYPIIFECEDGSEPQPGCSGSPIIEARVILGHEPKWQFKVVGALYARCLLELNGASANNKQNTVKTQSKLVCAIPIIQEFSQILRIIQDLESAERTKQMAAAASIFNDCQGRADAHKYTQMSTASLNKSKIGVQKFESGETILNISLPDGLEKLWYRTIVGIEDSLLIEKVRERELGRNIARNYRNVKSVELDELQRDFNAFIQNIRNGGPIQLKKADNFAHSPGGHFRIDVGLSIEDWMLDIQDNTGKHSYKSLPFSSIFAKVKIPKSSNPIAGDRLAELFMQSHANREATAISLNETATPAAARPRRS